MDNSSIPPLSRNARIGLALFFVYCVFYGSFVAISAFRNEWMGIIVFAGLNLAIVWGLGLIFLAILLAIIYMSIANDPVEILPSDGSDQ